MFPINRTIDSVLLRFTVIISLIVAISLPTIYAFLEYSDLSKHLTFKAKIKSNAQSEMITTLPNTWMYAENRMQGLLAREPVTLENEYIQIFDLTGNALTSVGTPINGISMQRQYPLYDIGDIVGYVVIKASMSHIIVNTFITALIGLFLGFCVLLLLWFIPVKKLRAISNELEEEKQQAEITLKSINDAIFRTDKYSNLIYLNLAAEKLIGYSFEELKGKSISEILTLFDSQTMLTTQSTIYNTIKEQKSCSCKGTTSLLTDCGKLLSVEEQAVPIFDKNHQLIGAVLCLSDVSFIREKLAVSSWEAMHDSLTGLNNRRGFQEKIHLAIEDAHRSNLFSMVCFMDLDRFKVVNDTCGHSAGDDLLVELSQIISSQIRSSDSIARLGGDEFGLLLHDCNIESAQIIATNILKEVNQFQFICDGKIHTVGVSIGLTYVDDNTYSVKDVLSEADSACYWAKESGRHRFCVFQDNVVELTARREEINWVERIKSALLENRFILYHQNYKTLNKDESAAQHQHLEILLRLISKSGGIVSPNQFLPAAERYDLIKEVDQWVINKVFSEFKNIQSMYSDSEIMVNINLSGASINSVELFDFINKKSNQYNIKTTSICFEITETVAVRNLRSAIEFINKCKKLGFKFALDDFGTGASSFSYLKNLPVDYLKIDGSFVSDIEHDSVDKTMVQAINQIGHLLGKKTIAEFAENQAIIDILEELGIDFAQGYGVCKPVPLFADDTNQYNRK